jgi:hypothetical protein
MAKATGWRAAARAGSNRCRGDQVEKKDLTIKNPNVGFVYKRAEKSCGWRDIGASEDLKKSELSVYEPTDKPDQRGYAQVSVVGNSDLALGKGFDNYGGGCWISVGVKRLFGMKNGQWVNKRRRFDWSDFTSDSGCGGSNLPYQTLISSLLHKYAAGRLKEV